LNVSEAPKHNHKLVTLEVGDRHVGDIRVQLLLGVVVVVVTLAGNSYTDAVGDVLDTTGPQVLVQGGVKADILGAHLLESESLDRLHSGRSTLLEGAAKCK
jgi:hypothetical protein